MQLCGSLSILWHCLSLELDWKLTFSSAVATAEFSNIEYNFHSIIGWTYWLISTDKNTGEVMACYLKISCKKTVASVSSVLSHSRLLTLEEPAAMLWAALVGKSLWQKMYVSGQQPMRTWDLTTARWVSLGMLAAPSPNLDCSLGRDSESKPPSLAAPRFLAHRICEIINVCCFKPTECGGNLFSSPV